MGVVWDQQRTSLSLLSPSVVRHQDVSSRNWGRRDRFRLEVWGGGQGGSREIWAELRGGQEGDRSQGTHQRRAASPRRSMPTLPEGYWNHDGGEMERRREQRRCWGGTVVVFGSWGCSWVSSKSPKGPFCMGWILVLKTETNGSAGGSGASLCGVGSKSVLQQHIINGLTVV